MNEVEKMYKTIFGEFAPNCSLCTKLIDCEIINNTHNCNKFECDYERLFTAEKQLELIKWLAKKNYGYQSNSLLINVYDGITCLQAGISCGEDLIYDTYSSDGDTLEEAIAKILRFMWNKLTEEERKQIKNILEIRE